LKDSPGTREGDNREKEGHRGKEWSERKFALQCVRYELSLEKKGKINAVGKYERITGEKEIVLVLTTHLNR
jgi:hypothetical protein